MLNNEFTVKTVSILGVTGTIGDSTLKILSDNPNKYRIVSIIAQTNYRKLAQIANIFKPKVIAIESKELYPKLKELILDKNITILAGKNGVLEAASHEVDITISAITGINGLLPTIEAIKSSKLIGLANKESMVCAGNLINKLAKNHNTIIIPLDSEHNSIFRTFDFDNANSISRIILTASGGPFLNNSVNELENITPKQALKHPTWNMGPKISIDSATMMNKALEIIEAFYLFPVKKKNIDVVIHPQSIVHSLVHYVDGSVKSLMSLPDMRTSISYALSYPKYLNQNIDFDITSHETLNFHKPCLNRFPALQIAKDVLENEDTYPIVMNAANEFLVESFLKESIKFTDIIPKINEVLDKFPHQKINDVDDILYIDKQAKILSKELTMLQKC
jgi:1-deoxy-D-xylulose-5-phosphate reductoisomerase